MTRETRDRLTALAHTLRSCAWESRTADPAIADVLDHIAGRIECIACDDAEPSPSRRRVHRIHHPATVAGPSPMPSARRTNDRPDQGQP